MKRCILFLLIFCFLFSGCGVYGDRIKEPVTFYYVRSDYQQDLSVVFESEEREASGHRNDLSYLMALYLMGPANESLRSPVPAGTRIYVETNNQYHVKLTLSESTFGMTDTEFSLICACLSMTCLDITQTETVTITCGSRSASITRDNLALTDSTITNHTKESQ